MCPQGTSASQSAQPKPAQVPVALLKVTSNTSLHTCLRPRPPLSVGTSTLHPGIGSPRAQEKAPDSLPSSCLSHSLQGQVTGTGSWCKREDSANASHRERRPPGSVDRKRAWNPEGQHASKSANPLWPHSLLPGMYLPRKEPQERTEKDSERRSGGFPSNSSI